MRKIYYYLTFSVFLSVFLVGCEKNTNSVGEETSTEMESDSANMQAKPSSVTSSILLDLNEVKGKIENYKSAHPGVAGDEYALHSWISIEHLKNYIEYVENLSKIKGINISGIDFVHVQNNNAAPGMSNPLNQDYDLTLMMVPTYKDSTNKNVAFDPLNSTTGNPKHLKEMLDSLSHVDKRSLLPKQTAVGNSITSCPNNCL